MLGATAMGVSVDAKVGGGRPSSSTDERNGVVPNCGPGLKVGDGMLGFISSIMFSGSMPGSFAFSLRSSASYAALSPASRSSANRLYFSRCWSLLGCCCATPFP